MARRRILFVTSEAYPLIKTGGLGDYANGLVKALTRRGHDVRVLLPAYAGTLNGLAGATHRIELGDPYGVGPIALVFGAMPNSGYPVWLIDCPSLYARAGGIYQDESGNDWPDNAQRFGLLALVAARIGLDVAPVAWRPEVVHLNEWQTGPAAALLAQQDGAPPSLFTIHNMAFQGLFDPDVLPFLRLPQSVFAPQGLEFYGQLSYLKAGIRYASCIATVSKAYAEEILTPEFGFGLEGLLAKRANDLIGILNGADYDEWDPRSDRYLVRRYGAHDVATGKQRAKHALRERLALTDRGDVPLFAFVSRITHQKMADVLVDAVPQIIGRGAQVAMLGHGERAMEDALVEVARRLPGELAVNIGYNEDLAHQTLAGADMLLAPARFEPCGLTQMYALRYGTVPIVSNVGGLRETVVDSRPDTIADLSATGFKFVERTCAGLLAAVDRAVDAYRTKPLWQALQRSGMQVDFSWDHSAQQYERVYEALVGSRTTQDAATELVRSHLLDANP
jgi:starch synthase